MIALDTLYLSAEYQPLIQTSDLQVYGYEALSRFRNRQGVSTPPNVIFEQLHSQTTLLANIEMKAKQFQLEHSNPSLPLFINLDPHAIENSGDSMLALLSTRADLTVEIIENTCINDANLSTRLVSQLKAKQISVALDDIGAPHSMLSLELLSQVNILKFDIEWLNQSSSVELQHLMKALIQFAKDSNKKTVLEGVETREQLKLAQELGVDLVQGFLFKPQFQYADCSVKLI
ncbi:EAL domain-containing protein [Shewanella canadensis]|uniref:EAL domain-containing protein n=1 Tax=Shewanella canadensis TaxID=271096 RepID=A0A3S0ILK7_9GAMM|nr:EAL domain-containing protein [Shewanella canadensis]RTR37961.1 EAL domain-containing protein [Shewanella canadensis]